MTFKSYAQAGQFGTYHIDLPIKAEINEDLRAAGDFAKQMERSQKYREKWASSYLSALNDKSNIERQNRDDNFEFLQNNFKRIYEGEQREFEGRMGELKREQAEAAGAEPGFLEKLVPLLTELAPMALNAIGQMQAAELQATNEWSQGIHDTLQQNGAFISIPELANLKKLSTQSPGAAEALFKAKAEGTGVGWQDLQRYTMLSGEAEAFRNMNTGLTHLGKVEHLIRQDLLPDGYLYPGGFAGNDSDWYDTFNTRLAQAEKSVWGDYELNDATQAAVNKWRAGIKNDANRQYFNIKEGQSKAQYEQDELHKFNFLATQDSSEVGKLMYERLRSQKAYYIGRGFTSEKAHRAAFKDMDDFFLSENSLATVEDYDLYISTFHAKRNEYIIEQGGAPIEKGKGWAYETSAITRRKMVEGSFKLTTHATNTRLNDEKKKKNAILAKANSLKGAQQRDFITQVQKEHESSGTISSQGFDAWIKSLGHNSVIPKSKTFEQQTGMTRQSLVDTTKRKFLSILTGAGSAHNNKQTKGDLIGLQSTQENIEAVVGNAQVNWTKYAGEFPHITNPEALRKEILTRSYQDLMDKGEIGLKNVNADGTAKVPAEAVTFKSIGGENPTGMTVQGFEDKAKQEGDKFYKTFTPLTPTDSVVYDNYAKIRGSMSVGENPDWRDMQMMANTKRMRSLKKVHKDKSIYEIMDLDLKSLGYEGLRTIPLTKAQVAANKGIAKRILEGNRGGITTTQNIRTANIITNGIQNKGKLVPVNIGGGRTVNLSNAGAAQALQSAVVAAGQAGVDLSVIINNAGRTNSENYDAGGDPNSNHLWGGAIDINWNAQGAYWWKENAHHFGFVYNPYSSKSTHYDFDATTWQQSPYSKQKLEPATVQPQQQQPSNQVNTEEGVLNPNYQPEPEAPNQWWDFLDLVPNERQQQVPDQLEGLEPSFMTNGGELVGVRNGQKVRVQPGTTTPIPISDRMYEAMLEDRDKDKPFKPLATLSGGN